MNVNGMCYNDMFQIILMIACFPCFVLIMSFLLSTTVYIKAILNTALSMLITSIPSIIMYYLYEHLDL